MSEFDAITPTTTDSETVAEGETDREADAAAGTAMPAAEYEPPAEPEFEPATEPATEAPEEPGIEVPEEEPESEVAGAPDAVLTEPETGFEAAPAEPETRTDVAAEPEAEFDAVDAPDAAAVTETDGVAAAAEPDAESSEAAPVPATAEPAGTGSDAEGQPAGSEQAWGSVDEGTGIDSGYEFLAAVGAEAVTTPATEFETPGGAAAAGESAAEAGRERAEEGTPETEPPAGPRTIGRYIADALRAAGVRYAFTVPGESFLGLLDAFEAAGIRVVATRHEGAASFMAEAHGQLTGRPAVCLGTRAVGGANMAIGIHTARQDSTPMFAVTGQVERPLLGREAFQEIDQVATLGGLAKWATEPRGAEEVPEAMAEAVRQALGGRPGPVLLSLPEDLLDEPMPDDPHIEAIRPGVARPNDEEIRAVIEMLASAERPVILAGAGVLRARTSTELTRFAELLQVPVIAAWRRGDVISNDHPLYLGMAGMAAAHSIRERLEAADAILVLGSRLNEATTYGYAVPRPGQPWAHVDLAAGRSTGSPTPTISVTADAKAFIKAANDRLLGRAVLDAGRVATRQANNAADRATWEASSVVDDTPWDGPGVHPGRVIATLRRVLPDDAILTTDAGNFGGWAARGFRFRRPGTFLGSTSGAMGYGLPAAISAALVHRDRHVVALVGDGGLGMTMAELETAVRVGARVVVLCFDNERYGTIRMWQERRRTGVGVATELGPVDFAAIARACGARGVRVEHDSEFEAALRTALVADRATVIQLTLDRAWLSVDEVPG